MPHFILRYRGSGSAQPADVGRIRALSNAQILDASSDRMILVEASEEHLRAALKDMPGWVMIPEQTVPLPDPRKKVLHPPSGTEDDRDS